METRPDLTEQDAAIRLQRWWRKYLDVNVYRYYRDLISFRQKGDPSMMLRAINPGEARYLDSAAGVHVKFRLAGEHFPPQIYYKIFTHRPIQDIGAYAPRDYTRQGAKIPLPRIRHNKMRRTDEEGRDGWYKRFENNGWRLVSDRVIHRLLQTSMDPVTVQTSDKRAEFHYSRLQRRQDVDRRRKQKKLDWMRQMYAKGLANDLTEKQDSNTTDASPNGEKSLLDGEVDELIRWSDSLNFEDYWFEWKELATTANSDFSVQERIRLSRSLHDSLLFMTDEGSLMPSHDVGSSREMPDAGSSSPAAFRDDLS